MVEQKVNFYKFKKIQYNLSKRVVIKKLNKHISYIAGVDAIQRDNLLIAVACLYKYPEINFLESAYEIRKSTFPYIPGFLCFREGDAMIEAVRKLKLKPDVLLIDGQGIAHPRRLGVACYVGISLKIPTIGCAKSKLIGQYKEPDSVKESFSYLFYNNEIVGVVVRTRENVKPVFVSPGHLIDVESALKIVINCSTKYRIPEPLRCADIKTKQIAQDLFQIR